MSIQTQSRPRPDFPVLAAAGFAVLLWGATPLVTKLAVTGLDGLGVGLMRTLLAGLMALPIIAMARLPLPRPLGPVAVSALGGFILFPILFSLGQERTSAAHGALILATLPILTGLIAAMVERRWPLGRWWLGAVIAGLGTLLLISGRFDLSQAGGDAFGNLLILLGALSASVGYVTGARSARNAGTWAVTFWGIGLSGLVLLPISPFLIQPAELADLRSDTWACLVYLAAGSSIAAYAAWYWALGRGGISRIALAQYLQPLVGVALAVLVLNETLTWPVLLSGLLIVGGVVLAGRAPRSPQSANKGET